MASKCPILEAEFVPFLNKKSWQILISYGCILAKVDLGKDEESGKKCVGYIGNLHTMAYQEKENQIGKTLSEVSVKFEAFRRSTKKDDEEIKFAVVGGDFNFDNISPGDSNNHDYQIFQTYNDVCAQGPGKDKPWALGTELRQLRVGNDEVDTPEKFKIALDDPVRRRFHVIDADVKVI